ncbi:MAG: protoheme IX farnesyltransferase [Betaproteobacteria bacterium]|nr:protoheme IX farnesyltransferase [Betaproteobacteria bacterium]
MQTYAAGSRPVARLAAFFELCKPRVNSLIVFTAMIGMWLAAPDMAQPGRFLFASIGIALVAGAAAAINCLVERTSDALMARTRARGTASGSISAIETLTLATLIGGVGLWLLHAWVNDLTMWLTLATFFGYAVIYTVVLKPMTPMNIVIGGAAGAMPPVLGWAAMTDAVGVEAFSLFLIVFLWTPPHFWSLACYRREEFARASLPMLPVTHGLEFTCRHILLYTALLTVATLLPLWIGLSAWWYLAVAAVLNAGFLACAIRLCRSYSDDLARKTFRYSIMYLTVLFAALIVDRLLRF